MLLSCSQPRQHIFLSDVLFPFIIPNLEQSWHFYCVIIFYGLSSPFALHLAERRIPKPVLWISLLPKKIDQQNCKSGVRRRNKHPQTGVPVTNITLHVACCKTICGYWLLSPWFFSPSVPWRWMKTTNCLPFACHFTANRDACLSTQEITITPLKSE